MRYREVALCAASLFFVKRVASVDKTIDAAENLLYSVSIHGH